MTNVNTYIMKAIAKDRIADLHRDAVRRPEATPTARRPRRPKRSAKRAQTVATVRADQR